MASPSVETDVSHKTKPAEAVFGQKSNGQSVSTDLVDVEPGALAPGGA
jgi:hypothetical protein